MNKLKKMLYSYTYIKFKIDATNENLNNLASMINIQREVKTPTITGLPAGNDISDPVGQAAAKIIDKYTEEYNRYAKELETLYEQKNMITKLMADLEPLEEQIIALKFFKKYKWWMVAQTINYSERHCKRICNQALKTMLDKKA